MAASCMGLGERLQRAIGKNFRNLKEETVVRHKEELLGSDSGGRLQVNLRTSMPWLGRKSLKWDQRRNLVNHRGFKPHVWIPSRP